MHDHGGPRNIARLLILAKGEAPSADGLRRMSARRCRDCVRARPVQTGPCRMVPQQGWGQPQRHVRTAPRDRDLQAQGFRVHQWTQLAARDAWWPPRAVAATQAPRTTAMHHGMTQGGVCAHAPTRRTGQA